MRSTRRPWFVGVACGVLVVAGAAAFVAHNRPRSCTDIGPGRTLVVALDPSLRHEVTTIRVHLVQGDRDEAVDFVPEPTNKYDAYIERGVYVRDGAYDIALDGLGSRGALVAGWAAGERARVVVEGFAYSGKKAFRHAERFTFDTSYPNGKACDKDYPGLHHATRVTAADRL